MFLSPTILSVTALTPCGLAFSSDRPAVGGVPFLQVFVEITHKIKISKGSEVCKTSRNSNLFSLKMQSTEVCFRLLIYSSICIYHK